MNHQVGSSVLGAKADMLAIKHQTPTFVLERDIDRLKGKLPPETVERLGTSMQQFRAWVAAPALRKNGLEDAVKHVVQDSAAVAMQFKLDFIGALVETDGAMDVFLEAVTGDLAEAPAASLNEDLALAIDLLVSGLRSWVRFFSVHPDLDVEAMGWTEAVTEAIGLGFHADNLITICFFGLDGECGEVDEDLLAGLCAEAKELAGAYYATVRDMVEAYGPSIDEEEPFRTTTVQDLLNLPPYDGETATIEEMDEAIASQFESE